MTHIPAIDLFEREVVNPMTALFKRALPIQSQIIDGRTHLPYYRFS